MIVPTKAQRGAMTTALQGFSTLTRNRARSQSTGGSGDNSPDVPTSPV